MLNKGKRATSPILFGILFLASTAGFADMYLKIEGIPGESKDAAHADWIDLLSVSSAIYNPAPIDQTPVPSFHGGIIVTKRIDKSTPLLMEAVCTGDTLSPVTLEVTRSTGVGTKKSYFEWRLKEAIVSSSSLSAFGLGFDAESVSFEYNRVDWYYRKYDPDGNKTEEISAFWDVQKNEGGQGQGNQAPTIEQAAQQSVQPGESRDVSISIYDPDTIDDSLTVEATTPDADLIKDLMITGSGNNRTLSFTASALNSGSATINVSVSDGESMEWMAFSVLIDVDMTPFEAFLAAYFSDEELLDNELVSPIGDPDMDQIATIVEFMLGSNPRTQTLPEEILKVRRVELPGGPAIVINFRRRNDEPNIRVIPWLAAESLEYAPLTNNPLYEETGNSGENPLYEEVEGTIYIDPSGYDTHLIRMQVQMD